MPVDADFKFSDSTNSPAVRAEAERRAVVMFGPDWRTVCEEGNDRQFFPAIGHNHVKLSLGATWLKAWTRDEADDLPDGSPACIKFHAGGQLMHITYCRAGKETAPAPGRPAHVDYFPSGAVKREVYYTNGRIENPVPEHPGIIEYYPNGIVKKLRTTGRAYFQILRTGGLPASTIGKAARLPADVLLKMAT